MKQLSFGINIMLLVLVGILFYLHFHEQSKAGLPAASAGYPSTKGNADAARAVPGTRIAYFEMDSLQSNYTYFKEALNHLKDKEQAMNAELAGMEKAYQQKVAAWQHKGAAMSVAETEAAQRENAQLQQNYQARKQALDEGFARQSMDFKKDIKKRIEDYLTAYNRDKNYSYILSYEPDFIFYRDTTFNITADLIEGLNAADKK